MTFEEVLLIAQSRVAAVATACVVGYLIGYYRGRVTEYNSGGYCFDSATHNFIESQTEQINWLRGEFDLNCAMGRLTLRSQIDRHRDSLFEHESDSVKAAVESTDN